MPFVVLLCECKCKILFQFQRRNKWAINEMMNSTMNTMKRSCAIAIENPATPPNPRRAATMAITKKITAQYNNPPNAIKYLHSWSWSRNIKVLGELKADFLSFLIIIRTWFLLIVKYRSARKTILLSFNFYKHLSDGFNVEFDHQAVKFSDKQTTREIVGALYKTSRIALFHYHFFSMQILCNSAIRRSCVGSHLKSERCNRLISSTGIRGEI